MEQDLLQYLFDNDNGSLISINDKLIGLSGNQNLTDTRETLRNMRDSELIEFSGDLAFLGATHQGVLQDLNSVPLKAKIKTKGKDKLASYKTQATQHKLAEEQLADLPKNDWYRRKGFIG